MAENPLPTTVDEAIQWMFNQLDEANRQKLKSMEKIDLIWLHHGYGAGIRNALNLWAKDNPLAAQPELRGKHPDSMSGYLIERLWEYLQDETA